MVTITTQVGNLSQLNELINLENFFNVMVTKYKIMLVGDYTKKVHDELDQKGYTLNFVPKEKWFTYKGEFKNTGCESTEFDITLMLP